MRRLTGTNEERVMMRKARLLCKFAHRGQTRKHTGKPYWTHPAAVAEMLPTAVERTVAYLHDVVEDTDWSLARLTLMFPRTIVDAVGRLTRGPQETYAQFITRIAGHELATRVKIADINHNLSDLPNVHATTTLRLRYIKALKYLEDVQAVRI